MDYYFNFKEKAAKYSNAIGLLKQHNIPEAWPPKMEDSYSWEDACLDEGSMLARDDVIHFAGYTLTFGTELVINPLYRQVHLKGRSIQLTRREFDLLYLLASRPGQVFSREQLYRHIWNTDTEFGVGEAVRFQIKSLRKKLTRTGSNYIQSVREIGYCFSGNP